MVSQRGGRTESQFVLRVTDFMSETLNKIGKSSGGLTRSMGGLAGSVQGLLTGMIGLQLALTAIPALLGSFAIAANTVALTNYRTGLRRATVQLRLLGFSLEESEERVRSLENSLDRGLVTAVLRSGAAVEALGILPVRVMADFAKLAEQISKIFGADTTASLEAVFEALHGNKDALFAISGITEEMLTRNPELSELSGYAFLEAYSKFINEVDATDLETLAEALTKMNESMAPWLDPVSDAFSGGAVILMDAFAERLERLSDKEGIDASHIVQISAAVGLLFDSFSKVPDEKVLGRFTRLGRGLGVGLLTGIALGSIEQIDETWEAISEKMLLSGGLALGAATIGKSFGGKFGAAAAVAAVAAILPGIVKETGEGTSRAEVQIAFGIAGASIAKMMGKGMIKSAVIGFIVADFTGAVHDAIKDEENDKNSSLSLAGQVMGAIIIGGATRSPIGGAIGASIGDQVVAYFEKENPEQASRVNSAIGTHFSTYAIPVKLVRGLFKWGDEGNKLDAIIFDFFGDMIDSTQRNHGTLIGSFGFGDLISEKIASELSEAFPGVAENLDSFFTNMKDNVEENKPLLVKGFELGGPVGYVIALGLSALFPGTAKEIDEFFDNIGSKISDSGVRVYNFIGAAIIGAVNAGISGITVAINSKLLVAEAALGSLTTAVNKWIAIYNKYMPGPNISSIPSIAFPNVELPTFTFTPQPLPTAPDDYGDPEAGGADDDPDYVADVGPVDHRPGFGNPSSPNIDPYSNNGPRTITVNVQMDTDTVATKVLELERNGGSTAGYTD